MSETEEPQKSQEQRLRAATSPGYNGLSSHIAGDVYKEEHDKIERLLNNKE